MKTPGEFGWVSSEPVEGSIALNGKKPPYAQQRTSDEKRLVEGVDDFQIVLPVSEIQSANLFDSTAYQLFNPTAAS